MFPLSDSHKTESFPFINFGLIALCVFAFFVQLMSPDLQAFILQYGFIPSLFNLSDSSSAITLLTSMFLHGGVVHLLSNVWFLHIFGDNVEDMLGHTRYLLFYIVCGIAATLAQYWVQPGSSIPMIGASGAISGVAGAYFVYFKQSTVKTLITFFYMIDVVKVPSVIFLGYWFLIQLFSGVGSLATTTASEGGVAWFAHIGGFVCGYILCRCIPKARKPQ